MLGDKRVLEYEEVLSGEFGLVMSGCMKMSGCLVSSGCLVVSGCLVINMCLMMSGEPGEQVP